MLSHVKAVSDFIIASKGALGDSNPAVQAIQETQVTNLVAVIKKSRPTMEDASCTLVELAKPMPAFTDDQRSRLAAAVAGVTSDGNMAGSTAVVTTRAQPQTHLYVMNYLTSSDWSVLQSQVGMCEKMNALLNRCFTIGLLHPTEKTMVSLLSIILSATTANYSAEEKLNLMMDMKKLLKTKRVASPNLSATCLTFPMHVSDFLNDHPDTYPTGEMPVMCPINMSTIEEMRLSTAARRTHKSLSSSSASSSGRDGAAARGQDMFMAFLANSFMQGQINPFGMSNKRSRSGDLNIQFPSHHRVHVATPLALADRVDDTFDGSVFSDLAGTPTKEPDLQLSLPISSVTMPTSPPPSVSSDGASAGPPSRSTSGIDTMIKEMQSQIKANSDDKKAADAEPTPVGNDGTHKRNAKAKAKTKAKGKAKVMSTCKAPAKSTAKSGKAKSMAKGKAPNGGATTVVVDGVVTPLGCGKCRGSCYGCKQCRSPKFGGARWQA